MEKLLDCPLCGGGSMRCGGYLGCRDCSFTGPIHDPDGSKWNSLVTYIRAGMLREKHPEINIGYQSGGNWGVSDEEGNYRCGTFQNLINEAWEWVEEEK